MIQRIPDGFIDTIEKETLTSVELSEIERLHLALERIGIIDQTTEVTEVRDVLPWQRGGAETFICVVQVGLSSETIRCIAKALVSFGTKPEDQLASWIRRRQLLSDAGVAVPRLYGATSATIYEQYIDDRLPPSPPDLQPDLLIQVIRVAAILDALGFVPVDFLRDLRVEDGRAYYVDFGSDLGDPSETPKGRAWATLCQRLSRTQLPSAEQHYSRHLSSRFTHTA